MRRLENSEVWLRYVVRTCHSQTNQQTKKPTSGQLLRPSPDVSHLVLLTGLEFHLCIILSSGFVGKLTPSWTWPQRTTSYFCSGVLAKMLHLGNSTTASEAATEIREEEITHESLISFLVLTTASLKQYWDHVWLNGLKDSMKQRLSMDAPSCAIIIQVILEHFVTPRRHPVLSGSMPCPHPSQS